MSDFIIRKKNPYGDEKNSVSLFNSVLSSLRKDRKWMDRICLNTFIEE